MYPWAMMRDLPNIFIKTNYVRCEDDFGFVDVTVDVPETTYIPVVPIRSSLGVAYPYGSIRGIYFSEEVKQWINLGYKITYHQSYVFTRVSGIFDSYVKHFYQMKSNSHNTQFRTFYKLMLNGLYGTLGMSPYNYKHYLATIEYRDKMLTSGKLVDHTSINNTLIELITIDSKPTPDNIIDKFIGTSNINLPRTITHQTQSNVAMASAITAYARMRITKDILSFGDRAIYSDTDSIIVQAHPENYVTLGDDIGQYKAERLKDVVIINNKTYAYQYMSNASTQGDVVKIAGLPQDRLRNNLSLNDMKSVLINKTSINYEYFNHIKNIPDLSMDRRLSKFTLKYIPSEQMTRYHTTDHYSSTPYHTSQLRLDN